MRWILSFALGLSLGTLFAQSTPQPQEAKTMTNPFFQPFQTPFGVPPFDKIKNEDYLPAILCGLEEQRKEIEAIASQSHPPTFANTVEAIERSGQLLARVVPVFQAVESANTNESLQKISQQVSPLLSAHVDNIYLDARLFQRVNALYQVKDQLNLSPEQAQLLKKTYRAFIRSGVGVPADKQPRLREINQELAKLSNLFTQNLLAETNDFALFVENKADLGGLPQSLVDLAASEAEKRGKKGQWAFTLQRPSINPFLQYCPNRQLRKIIFNGYANRANRDNAHDNKKVLAKIADLRAERAQLMGYKTHAHYVMEDNMAETPERVYQLLDKLWKPALQAAIRERADLQDMLRKDGISGQLEAWDWRYYSERVRKERYAIDEEQLLPYFEVNAVRDGVFAVVKKLYGLTFHERKDLPLWHHDQQAFEVKDKDGSFLGVVYLDFFARSSKSGGAWMNNLRNQSKLDGKVDPIVTTNFNFPPPSPGSPSLISFIDAETFFHEFGHALHGLLSNVTYASLSGVNVPTDFGEFPSQVMENWLAEPEVLRMVAKHYKSGEVIPESLIQKLQAAEKYGQGFATVEYLASTYLDLNWYTLEKPANLEVNRFEKEAMTKLGLIDEIIPRYRSTYYAHVFADEYSAGYYSYIWSAVLDSDAFQAFKETSLFDPATAARYRTLLSKGGSEPGMALYRAFRGRDPKIEPLLEKRGLNQP